MHRRIAQRAVAFAFAASMLVSACGGSPQEAVGSSASAGDADRIVDVAMTDGLVYDPDVIEVKVGETITFQVVNEGQTKHEFTLGTVAVQEEHEAEMAEMAAGMTMSDDNVLSLEGGESGEITWNFSAPGTYQYACHEPDHYDAGMIGTITVTA